MEPWRRDEEMKRQYQAGYRSPSVELCPYANSSGDCVAVEQRALHDEWLRGYHKHQADRRVITLKAAAPYCQQPLTIRSGV